MPTKHAFFWLIVAPVIGSISIFAFQPKFLENEYYRIHSLLEHARHDHPEDRKARAVALGEKVRNYYQSLESLSLVEKTHFYWCKHDSLKSRLPMNSWPIKDESVSIRFDCTQDALRAVVTLKKQPLLLFLLIDGMFTEMKHPHGGVPGMQTTYSDDRDWTRLTTGIDPYLICLTGFYRSPWVSRESAQSLAFERMISHGLFVAKHSINGESCDVIVADYDGDLEVFYVNGRGFVMRWIKVRLLTEQEGTNNRFIQIANFRLLSDIFFDSTDAFQIPPDWGRASQSWRTLSALESKELLEKEMAEARKLLKKNRAK